MRINSLDISGIGGIKELNLQFNSRFNAICGPNGVGKTTILKTIAHAFSSNGSNLKRNANYSKGSFTLKYYDNNVVEKTKKIDVTEFEPQNVDPQIRVDDCTSYLMVFMDNRTINYVQLNSIPRDENKNVYAVGSMLETGISIEDMKGWLANRCLFDTMPDSLSNIQKSNLKLAKKSFSLLNPLLSFYSIDSNSLDIILKTNNGNIYFEYLSAGYKSCIYLVMGLIKEIELRFGKECMEAEKFNGVILIDELDLHLHPTWQAKLVEALKGLFTEAQFIVTTHSPSILQTLNKNEIMPLTMDDHGNVSVKELNLTEYGLQGWTIEEILRDVMEIPETTSEIFESAKKGFEAALNKDDVNEAHRYYEMLKQMLHPDSILRRLIDIQMAGLGDN